MNGAFLTTSDTYIINIPSYQHQTLWHGEPRRSTAAKHKSDPNHWSIQQHEQQTGAKDEGTEAHGQQCRRLPSTRTKKHHRRLQATNRGIGPRPPTQQIRRRVHGIVDM